MKYKNQDIAFHFLLVIFSINLINYLNKFVHIIIALGIYVVVSGVEFLVDHTEERNNNKLQF